MTTGTDDAGGAGGAEELGLGTVGVTGPVSTESSGTDDTDAGIDSPLGGWLAGGVGFPGQELT